VLAGLPNLEGLTARSPAARAALRHSELVISRRLDGLLQGERRGRRPGPGSEPGLTRIYEPGDDVRWVDWRLSARSDEVYVRVPEIEPVLTAWALVDVSPSMAFGTTVRTKLDLAREVVIALGLLLSRRSDRLGLAMTHGGKLPVIHPPRGDRRGLIRVVDQLDREIGTPPAGRTDLVGGIQAIGKVARGRGLVVVISDFPNQPDLERAIGVLALHHEVIAIEVRDRRERELPSVGPMRLRDVETGRVVLVDTADPKFRERFAAATEKDAAARRAMFRRTGARHIVVSSDQDWLVPLTRGIAEHRRPRVSA
jgi:uncharacterized protein (DUF58 family)